MMTAQSCDPNTMHMIGNDMLGQFAGTYFVKVEVKLR